MITVRQVAPDPIKCKKKNCTTVNIGGKDWTFIINHNTIILNSERNFFSESPSDDDVAFL